LARGDVVSHRALRATAGFFSRMTELAELFLFHGAMKFQLRRQVLVVASGTEQR
jgi:hypothetical protein